MATSTPYQVSVPVTTYEAPGAVVGQNATDTVGFYGGAGSVQLSSPAQAALPSNGGMGYVTQYASSQTPSAVSANTVAEQSITVNGVAATDLVFVNKPTAQAGLLVLAPRVSAANTVKLVFGNNTGGSITPTGSEVYQITAIASNIQLSATLTPAAVAASSVSEQIFTCTGVYPGMVIQVNKPTTQAGLGIASARVVANNQIAIQFVNCTASPITPTAGEVYTVLGATGLAAIDQEMLFGVNVGTLAQVAANTTAEQTVTVNGLLATDVVIGVSKPTAQAGLGIVGWRVSAANTLAITFSNNTGAGITPTGSEVYNVAILRLAPLALVSVTTAPLIPIAVSANTTAEQTFTVSGLTAGTPVIVNKPTVTSGLCIAGARVSATNTLAITYANLTGASITPPAEVYTVGYSANAAISTGCFFLQAISQLFNASVGLTSAIRAALVAMNIIPGA